MYEYTLNTAEFSSFKGTKHINMEFEAKVRTLYTAYCIFMYCTSYVHITGEANFDLND